jgi:cell division septal protein FtsQ
MSALYRSNYFEVKNIKLEGSSLPTEEAARYCNIKLPVNIFKIDLDRLAADIKMNSELKQVKIERKLPHTLIVTTTTREPIAEIKVRDKFYRVDKEGFILAMYSEEGKDKLPDIVGINANEILPDISSISDAAKLQDALYILELLNEYGIADEYNIETIDVSNYRNPSIVIEDGIEIKVNSKQAEQKIKTLSVSLPSINLEQVTYIDLRFDDIVIGTE